MNALALFLWQKHKGSLGIKDVFGFGLVLVWTYGLFNVTLTPQRLKYRKSEKNV